MGIQVNYLQEAKKTQRAAEDTGDEGYADQARNLALIAIAEQLKRMADMMESNQTNVAQTVGTIAEGAKVTGVKIGSIG